MTPDKITEMIIDKDTLAEGLHTAFRKAVPDSEFSSKIWKLIKEMPKEEWSAIIDFICLGATDKLYVVMEETGTYDDCDYDRRVSAISTNRIKADIFIAEKVAKARRQHKELPRMEVEEWPMGRERDE